MKRTNIRKRYEYQEVAYEDNSVISEVSSRVPLPPEGGKWSKIGKILVEVGLATGMTIFLASKYKDFGPYLTLAFVAIGMVLFISTKKH